MPRRWRAFHTDLPRASGASVQLSPLESHHVRRVLRLSLGDPLALFDGCGNEWSGTIVGLDGDRVTVEMKQRLEDAVESALDVRVYQGLCRQEKMDQVVQKLTEIGVAAIHPLGCRNAERFPPDDKRLERWRRIAVEACKQSGRRRLPGIAAVERLPRAGEGACWLLDPGASAQPLAEVLARSATQPCRIAVGPESGFTADEIDEAVDAGWRRVSLGPRILRTETAGLVAACVLLHAWGDLGRRPC